MRAVNLMPPDVKRTRLEMGRLPLFAAAGGVVAVTAAAFFLASSASGSADETKAEVQAVEAAIAQLPTTPKSEVSVGMLAAERSSRVAALAAALSSRTAFDRVLHDISLVFPEDAWLTQLEASAPAVAAPAGGTSVPPVAAATSGVTITGATYSHESVATVLERLSVVPTLTDVRLTSTALVQPVEDETSTETKIMRPFVTFNVSATVKTGTTP